MKNLFKLLFASATLLLVNAAHSQLTGWPSSTNILNVPDGDIIYLDSNRIGITAVTTPSPNSILTRKSGSLSGNFYVGDFCLLISMEDPTNTGFHKSCTITAITSTTITVTPNNSAGWGGFTSMSKLQLVKVNVYRSITLNHGQITCQPYDNSTYTGGVLAFVCDSFYLNAGYVNVSGLGIAPYTTNYGIPGMGGAGSTVYSGDGGGYDSINTPPCYTPDPLTGKTLIYTIDGTKGDAGLANGTAGTGYTYTPTISNTTTNNSYPTRINMGRPGVLGTFANASNGGGGGGHGGKGVTLANSYINGDNGSAGGNGSVVLDENARSGGILIPKIKLLIGDNVLVTSKVGRFLSTGGYGSTGGNGGHGGYGGKGGLGETGFCDGDTIFFSGANGGYGEPGLPGNGGDGTNGGQSGSIWYFSDQTYPVIGTRLGPPIAYTAPSSDLFEVNGGEAGMGGEPGLAWKTNYYSTSKFDTTLCSPLEWCADSNLTVECNCDSIFNNMVGRQNAEYSQLGGYAILNMDGSQDYYFDSTWGVLKWEKSSHYHYVCPMANATDFKDIIKLLGAARLTPYQNDPLANIRVVLKSGKVRFEVFGTKWPLAEYDFVSHTLTDLDDPARKKVKEADCLYSYAAFGGDQYMRIGNSGNKGSDYPYPGSKTIGTPTTGSSSNVIFYSPAPAVEEEANNHVLENYTFNIFPNPNSTSDLTISCDQEIINIVIYDIFGNEVLKQTPQKKQFQIMIDKLSAGTYNVVCETNNLKISQKFIKLSQ